MNNVHHMTSDPVRAVVAVATLLIMPPAARGGARVGQGATGGGEQGPEGAPQEGRPGMECRRPA